MTYYMRAHAETSDGDGPIRFIASTEGVKRDGKDLAADGWRTANYQSNPVVLWSHGMISSIPPIGKAAVELRGNELVADVTFDRGDEFAREIERKYRDGYMSAVSVSWDDLDGDSRDLLEISAVPVPADPDALMERQARALADITRTLTEITKEPDGSPEPTEAGWEAIATEMVHFVRSSAHDVDADDHQATYRRLARAYERAGKVPPEYLPTNTLTALGIGDVRGLFVEGEPELLPDLFVDMTPQKRGAIEQAIDLLQGALRDAAETTDEIAGDEGGDPPSDEGDDEALSQLISILNGENNDE